MPTFSREENTAPQPIDLYLLIETSINLFHKEAVLTPVIEQLKEKEYEIITVDCSTFNTKEEFAFDIGEKLNFWGKWGGNLDAFNDFMRDVKCERNGKVLVFMGFEKLIESIDEWFALSLLNILEKSSRDHLLYGERLITILQTNNPGINIIGIGSTGAKWNMREMLFKSRPVLAENIKQYKYRRYEHDAEQD